MIKHICGDCGAQFHTDFSWNEHDCDTRCRGFCDHDRCVKCCSTNPALPCEDCLSAWPQEAEQ